MLLPTGCRHFCKIDAFRESGRIVYISYECCIRQLNSFNRPFRKSDHFFRPLYNGMRLLAIIAVNINVLRCSAFSGTFV